MKKLTLILVATLFAGISSAQMKNVAVVETDVDAQSGASAQLNPADVRLVTTELRREAVKNLPRDRYNIMTSETVIAQGSAVLDKCDGENCVITLGSAIGADYIVRGTISKVLNKFSLSVEMYETDNGNLVASSDPVRSESIGELLEKAAAACADMYETFANPRDYTRKPEPKTEPEQPATYIVTVNINPVNGGNVYRSPNKVYYNAGEQLTLSVSTNPGYTFTGWTGAAAGTSSSLTIATDGNITLTANFRRTPRAKIPKSIGAGGFIANDFGGGLTWSNGEKATIPNVGGGAYLFFDIKYAEIFAGYSGRSGKWQSPDAKIFKDSEDIPEWDIRYINIGIFAKYPKSGEGKQIFPLLGVDYEESRGSEIFDALWIKLGFGFEGDASDRTYMRAEFLYGWRTETEVEKVLRNDESIFSSYDVKTKPGHGLTIKVGIGIRL
jgi:uncharacterized repeat protein (TIGR02543 family)